MDDKQRFAELLDEIYPPVVLGGVEYLYSDAWESTDPISYQVAMSDWESGLDDGEGDW